MQYESEVTYSPLQ